jgi:3-oxoacyl-[acyl-carrier protein] reductase
MKYEGKYVVITGSSRGVGLMLANHFLNNGAFVIGISRGDQNSLLHHNYFHISLDLGNPDAIVHVFKKDIPKITRSIDILINNAALMTSQYAMIMPVRNAVNMINTNLLGVFMMSREAAKMMRNGDASRIINIGSMASSLEPAGDAVYAATKAAIITLANVLAKEFSSFNITSNTLCITAIETDMLRSHSSTAQEKIKSIITSLPLPRVAEIDDITNVIDFFASDMSTYVTGQTIYLGGVN